MEYNDFLIADADKMERIAREYQKALNSRLGNGERSKRGLEDVESYKNLIKAISEINFVASNIQNYCGTKFYSTKKGQLSTILKQLQLLPINTNQINVNVDNYCMAVDNCVKKTALAIQYAITTLKMVDGDDYDKIFEIIFCLTNLLPLFSDLFGVCKYRW